MVKSRRAGRIAALASGAVAVLAIGVAAGWGASVIFTPPQDVLSSTSFTTVEVVEGEVSSSFNLNTAAEWAVTPAGANQASGVVTGVEVAPGQLVQQGSELYSVNMRPVVVAAGAVPAYRALAEGIKGEDVAQLQSMLSTLGFYGGSADGDFGARTTAAVKSWQKDLGLDATGSVEIGDVIFVPTLPAQVTLDGEKVARGLTIAPGEEVVTMLSTQPAFSIPASASQAAQMPPGTRVEITSPSGSIWAAYADRQITDEQGSISVVLTGKDGGQICGDECGTVPAQGKTLLTTRIITVEPAKGPVVPSAALASLADGSVVVTDQDGTNHPVTVLASAQGMSVIDGVDVGTQVRVPGGTS